MEGESVVVKNNGEDKSDSGLRDAIAELVRTQRKNQETPLSQEELAHKAGISFEHLNHIENRKTTPSVEVLHRIAKALGFNRVSEFLQLDERGVL
jgi:transcriptional regulator with XRE-family HTH domain